ncbi:MAG: hypothetical protein U0325_16710 [Polyangiales bacterium]
MRAVLRGDGVLGIARLPQRRRSRRTSWCWPRRAPCCAAVIRGALVRLETFAAAHPDAPRAVERAGARLIARCAMGLADAPEVRGFLERHGASPLAAGVRDRCGAWLNPAR